MASRELLGVLPVIQTPFLADGGVDTASLASEIGWVLDQGVNGITTGMVSELLRLTESERRTVAEVVVETTSSRGALSVVSCGAESTVTATQFAVHAQQMGADAIMVNPPLTTQLDDAALVAHFLTIADAIDIGIVVQDASGYIGRPLSLEMQRDLLDRLGDQVYFKPEASPIGARLSQLRDLTDGRARIIEGTGGAALLDSYRRGVVGTMPGAEMCWGVQTLWDALGEGDWDLAYRLSGIMNSLIALQGSLDAFVAVEKFLLVRQGVIPTTAVRAPSGFVLDSETQAEVVRLFDLLRLECDAAVADLVP